MSDSTVLAPSVGPAGASVLSPAGAAARRARQARIRRRLAVVGLVLLAAIGYLVYKVLTSALVYFETASEAVAHRAELGNSTFQIEGVVVPGSVRQERPGGTGALGHAPAGEPPADLRFTIRSGSVEVGVLDTGAPPQLFQADVPVVLVGHFLGSTDSFSASQILVKHSNAYIAAHPGRVKGPTGKVVR